MLQHRASWNLLQLCSLVFGDVGMPAFVPAKTPITCRQKLYRACPTREDTTLMFSTMSGQVSDAWLNISSLGKSALVPRIAIEALEVPDDLGS